MACGGILYLVEEGQKHLPLYNNLRANLIIKGIILTVSTKNGRLGEASFTDTHQSAMDVIGLLLQRESEVDVLKMRTELAKAVGSKNEPQTKRRGFWGLFSSLF
jgi:hypothetical protein